MPAETIYLVDDDPSVRAGLSRLLRSAGYRTEAYACAESFLEAAPMVPPCCLILDVNLPGMDGLALQAQLAEHMEGQAIIFLTGRGNVPMSVQAIKAGAKDFLQKPLDSDALLQTIAEVMAAERALTATRAEAHRVQGVYENLTRRERDVLPLLQAGKSNKEIGEALDLGLQAVKYHRGHILQKFGVANATALTALAARHNLA